MWAGSEDSLSQHRSSRNGEGCAGLKDVWRLKTQSLRTGRWAVVGSGLQRESILSVPPHRPNTVLDDPRKRTVHGVPGSSV